MAHTALNTDYLLTLHSVATTISVILILVLGYPLLFHLTVGVKRKSDDIIKATSGDAARLYLKVFQGKECATNTAEVEFARFYHRWFGRRLLIFPVLITLLIAGLSAYLLGETAENAFRQMNRDGERDYFSLSSIAASALAGAYAFVCWDTISRVARRNLTPADILAAGIRLAVSIPSGYAFSAFLKDDVGSFIAFAVGAFPLQTVQTVLQRLANRQLGLEIGADSAVDQVTRLSGIDQPTADRVENADVTTIAQLAYCDPVQLSMRTNLDFAYISDIVGQAIAWLYLGNLLQKLRPIGLRGAVEFNYLLDDLERDYDEAVLDRELQGMLDGPRADQIRALVSEYVVNEDYRRLLKSLRHIFVEEGVVTLTKATKTLVISSGPHDLKHGIMKYLDASDSTTFRASLISSISSRGSERLARSSSLVTRAALLCNMSEAEFLNVADEIAYDPRTEFLVETW